jgi:type IV pilus assembly protein PilV
MNSCSFKRQGGALLIESLIAIGIFSFGMLGLIGMQATAIKQSADAKMRADASYLAAQMIGQMWIDRSNLNDYQYQETTTDITTCTFTGNSASTNVTSWLGSATQKDTVLGALPNANAQITVQTGNTGQVSVTVCWRAPQESTTHNFTTTALIKG